MNPKFTSSLRMKSNSLRAWLGMTAASLALGGIGNAQELILQEGFNTDGDTGSPKRYTLTGREVYEPQEILDDLGLFDQKGPIYWDHSFNISYVGNPNIPARRAIFTWTGVLADPSVDTATEDLFELFESTVNWLTDNKAAATIVVHPTVAAIGALGDHLTAAGHTLQDDDSTVSNELNLPGDLFIHAPGASNPSRFVLMPKPVIVINGADYDDMLVGSIGAATTFAPGQVTIRSESHPAAGGKTGSFDAFTGSQTFELIGSFLPTNTVTLATVRRTVPPSVASIADVEAMIAGTKEHTQEEGEVTTIDFGDASAGNWTLDYPIPGNYTGNWGLHLRGSINVATAGTYRFAVGSDDGARLEIDVDRNGFTADDIVINDPGPHAHQIVYANVTFAAAGNYDFQVLSYNSGGGGDLEVSVGLYVADEVVDDNLDSGYWEALTSEAPFSPVSLVGSADATGYMATGADVIREEPLVVLLNGPTETPPGAFYDGGPFSGFEGTGYLAGSGLNKWPYPTATDGTQLNYRSVQLNPVSVAGKQNVRLTVALAGTVVDFEDSDFIDVIIYPNGLSSTPITLAHFRGVQNAIQPWLADANQNFQRRLTRQFADFNYDIPPTATDLIVEIRAATSWWTETMALDNIRITAGAAATGPSLAAPTISGGNVNLSWTGGQAPYVVQQAASLPTTTWVNVLTNTATTATVPVSGNAAFFRVVSGATAGTP